MLFGYLPKEYHAFDVGRGIQGIGIMPEEGIYKLVSILFDGCHPNWFSSQMYCIRDPLFLTKKKKTKNEGGRKKRRREGSLQQQQQQNINRKKEFLPVE